MAAADEPDAGDSAAAVSQFRYSRLWSVLFHPEAVPELRAIPAIEQAAIGHAVEKLESLGPEASVSQRNFARAVAAAERRIKDVEAE
ncbi:hypothetical protein PSH03_000139 [Micromonospora sp. PSH03]|uniref:hypothetical protein n=1 Tax=Micromonospora TaxID=1873 RepID=UPI001EE9145B|nr:hypothetical protein [Micromonospora salmantinae]MCG5453958.1 hypothetical protein [Micromonospora salmantinae]